MENRGAEWHNAGRLVWLTGGVLAVNEPGPKVRIDAGIGGPTIYEFQIDSYPSLLESLRRHGFPIIGTTFIVSNEEIQGIRPPEFRAAELQPGWPVWDAKQQWRQIAILAGKEDQMQLMDVASRIASGLLYSQMRLCDLVTAYSVQLRCYLHENEAAEYQAFTDTNSFGVYKAIHALFWEMAVLRDTLAEFVTSFCFFPHAKAKTLKGLLKLLRDAPQQDPLAARILSATEESNGWLSRFTSYRNCFTHAAPMEQAAALEFTIQDLRILPNGLSTPQIYYALPKDIEELVRRRSKGALFSSFKELTAASIRKHERTLEPDALEYLHRSLNQFTDLALNLIARSPVAPQPIHIGPGDIIGEIKWNSTVPV